MGTIINVALLVIVIVSMIICCYFTAGLSNVAGTIFERKSTPEQRAAERGAVRGGRKQSA